MRIRPIIRSTPTVLMMVLMGLTAEVSGQRAGDPGVIAIGSKLVQVSVADGVVGFDDVGDDATQLERKLGLLAIRMNQHLAITAAQEERRFSDVESLHRGSNYGRKLVAKVELLVQRIVFLGDNPEFARGIKAAAAAFDVPLIKQRLAQKLALDDENVAEAAFQLAGFQELDGEYQDAWGNYQKASNLVPENQLYMDAHGKNEF